MFSKPLKNDDQYIWTRHAREKMRYYQLAPSRLKRLLRHPQRREAGIAPGTIALMQLAGTRRHTEIWLMYEETEGKKKIITAWRYPGRSKPQEGPPYPEDIKKEFS